MRPDRQHGGGQSGSDSNAGIAADDSSDGSIQASDSSGALISESEGSQLPGADFPNPARFLLLG